MFSRSPSQPIHLNTVIQCSTMADNIPHASVLLAASSNISIAAVNEDQEEEVESYMSALEIDNKEVKANSHYLPEPSAANKSVKVDHKQLKDNLKKASADIVVGNTQNEYRRWACNFGKLILHVLTHYVIAYGQASPNFVAHWGKSQSQKTSKS